MKRIRIACLTLVICFAGFSSFKSNQPTENATGLLYRWYHYDGGDPYEPESYTLLSQAPTCNSAEGSLCAIYAVTELLNDDHPSLLGLVDLGLVSCTFTQPYTGLLGKVRLTHE